MDLSVDLEGYNGDEDDEWLRGGGGGEERQKKHSDQSIDTKHTDLPKISKKDSKIFLKLFS